MDFKSGRVSGSASRLEYFFSETVVLIAHSLDDRVFRSRTKFSRWKGLYRMNLASGLDSLAGLCSVVTIMVVPNNTLCQQCVGVICVTYLPLKFIEECC